MAQKTKVKELVGRGLNSYHTKALQQIHRIEKKNKEQNHKISILSNELDNDYLTKTEEGSVISLEHSKEGMIYLDELQGNTLVNYCTDGSKELTLNGDIDVEGTFVTTTEGVDNGKVDIMCEGNTLVNNILNANKNDVIFTTSKRTFTVGKDSLIKDNTDYTVIFKISDINLDGLESASIQIEMIGGFENHGKIIGVVNKNGIYKFKHTTSTRVGNGDIVIKGVKGEWEGSTSTTRTLKISEVMLLEGDWTNKEIPSEYFEGMKSVGQDDENGHKIEILSAKGKPNLFKNSGFLSGSNNYNIHYGATCEIVDDSSTLSKKAFKFTTGITGTSGVYQNQIIPYIENIKYTISGWCKGEVGTTLQIHIERHKSINVNFTNEEWVRFEITSELNPTNWNRTITFYSANNSKVFYLKDIKAEKSDFATPYIPHTTESHYSSFMNKKEILINKPLRGLPNGVKDQIVKIGGKYFIERKCGELTLDNNSSVSVPPNGSNWYKLSSGNLKVNTLTFSIPKPSNCANTWGNGTNNNMAISDKFIIYPSVDASAFYDGEKIVFDSSDFKIGINKTKLTSQDIDGFKQWLQSNPVKVVYQLATPVYEPLEIEPVLNTYNDVTHISNNSIIPCNMKIKNTGYNAIIKPSTLYTVALDTNKSGTVGIDLGGMKTVTTNNVVTITTPAILSDDSLRLFGKGIKGSKVRLLEGDKTNWIPSFFEGMKSSFEDKVQDDGSYKMEILSNNENLFNINEFVKGYSTKDIVGYVENGVRLKSKSWAGHERIGFKVEPYTTYKVTFTIKKENDEATPNFEIYENDTTGTSYFWTTSVGTHTKTFTTKGNTEVFIRMDTSQLGYSEYSNVSISKISSNFIPQQSNKIQFSSIEPLRSVSDIKDRFVFKDNKLMIERNCITKDLTRSMSWSLNATGVSTNHTQFVCRILPTWNCSGKEEQIICTKKPTKYVNSGNNSIWIYDKTTIVVQMRYDLIKTKEEFLLWIDKEQPKIVLPLAEPTYEEIPFELQKIILEGYENSTLFFDTNIPPTSTITYAGETPIVKSVKLNKTEVLSNTEDINDNIIPYLMDMDYRVVCLQLQSENINDKVSMARLFGGVYEMLQRDIQSRRYSIDEYKHRLDAYLDANKITEEEYNKLGDMLNE